MESHYRVKVLKFLYCTADLEQVSLVQTIASSKNLDKFPQLQSQKPPDTQTPILASPASHHYHKGTNFTDCRELKSWDQKKIQEYSKIMPSFNMMP